jgi:hypothetical protein
MPDKYSDEEAQRRFEAALRGAREVGHEAMKDIPPKRSTLHAATKLGKRKAKTSTRMAKDRVVTPFSDALEELVFLLRQNGNPRDVVDGALQVFEHTDKCVVTKLQRMSAPITDDGRSAFQPSDLFSHYISAIRARDWPLVRVIKHQICSSSA